MLYLMLTAAIVAGMAGFLVGGAWLWLPVGVLQVWDWATKGRA